MGSPADAACRPGRYCILDLLLVVQPERRGERLTDRCPVPGYQHALPAGLDQRFAQQVTADENRRIRKLLRQVSRPDDGISISTNGLAQAERQAYLRSRQSDSSAASTRTCGSSTMSSWAPLIGRISRSPRINSFQPSCIPRSSQVPSSPVNRTASQSHGRIR